MKFQLKVIVFACLYNIRNEGSFEVVVQFDVVVDKNILQQQNDFTAITSV